MSTKPFSVSVFITLLAMAGREALSETAPARVTKCQLPDGRLYFGPSPPKNCETIAVYENGKQVDGTGPDRSPTVEGDSPGAKSEINRSD